MIESKNYNEVFLRKVIVGTCSFLYDIIKITEVVNNEEVIKQIPFFYSMTGDSQFLTDHFLDVDRYCKSLSSKVEGNIKTIPSGVIMLKSADPQTTFQGGHTRIIHDKIVEGDFGKTKRQYSSYGFFIPVDMKFEATVRCSSDIQRLKVWEAMVSALFMPRKFHIKHKVEKIPCMLETAGDISTDKKYEFRSGENKESPEVNMTFKVTSLLPVLDPKTTRDAGNIIERIEHRNQTI